MLRYPELQVAPSCGGHGVFALEPIRAGCTVLAFSGPRCGRAAVEAAALAGAADGYLQIGVDSFIGLSGGPDDFVNHSCQPNCFVARRGRRVYLVALEDIPSGAELTFDYGLTQIRFPFRFDCGCGRPACRGSIGNVDEIPGDRLAAYRSAGIVPDYAV